MRLGLLGVVAALALGSAASAQPAPAPPAGPVPYQLGMAQADVQASAPTMWTQQPGDGTSVTLTGGPHTPIGGQSFSPALTFEHGHLTRAAMLSVIASPDQQTCIEATTGVVAALEMGGGPLSGAAAPWEQGVLTNTVSAGSGSSVRYYTNANGGLVGYANRRGAGYLEVLAGFGAISAQEGAAPTQSCLVLVSLQNDPFPALAPHWQRGAPSEAQIAHAQLLEHPEWSARPGATEFERYFPTVALDRHIEGHVTLDCLVQGNGALRCRVGDETPAGLGFGQAAIDIAASFRAASATNGVRSSGKHVRVPITFRIG